MCRPELQLGRNTWRVGEFETDARVLFCRTRTNGQLARAALVDGSLVRSTGRARLRVMLPATVKDLHLDLRSGDARLSGDAAGARVQIGDREVVVEAERRARSL
jgi:hypothetical protein